MNIMGEYQNSHNRIDITQINNMIVNSPQELVEKSENHYFEQLREIAQDIASRSEKSSILLVSGPSGSTKTTTSQKLSEQLLKHSIHSVVISLDNFYINANKLPKLENGDTDFESINTIDIEKINYCFGELVEKKKSKFPIFDFKTGKRSNETNNISINENSIVIIEGIHALNPLIVQNQNSDSFLKFYISPSSDYFLGDEMVLSSRNIRFVRRLVRDYFYRGTKFSTTMDMWANVVQSEIINILPYKKEADYKFDSTILYEPALYEYFIEQILIPDELQGFYKNKVDELLKALAKFEVLPPTSIPKDTVLHEFIQLDT